VTYIYKAPCWLVKSVAYAPIASPIFTGDPKAPTPTAGDADTSIATTQFVAGAVATATVAPATVAPLINGTAAVGTTTKYAREDHIHPTDTTRVAKIGDTMTGALDFTGSDTTIRLRKNASGGGNYVNGYTGANPRWIIALGDAAPESGGNVGSGFQVSRYNDAGSLIGSPFTISRADGRVVLNSTVTSTSPTTGALTVEGGVGVGEALAVGTNLGIGVNPNIQPGNGNTTTGVTVQGGALFIGKASGPLSVWSLNAAGTMVYFNYAGTVNVGSISMTTTTTAFNTSSDERLKYDLQPFDAGSILDRISVYDFAWRANNERAHGVIAQDVSGIYPEAVTHDTQSDLWGIDHSKFVPLLLQAVKELRARVAALETAAI